MSERHKRFKPALIIGATMLGIAGTGIAIVLTHYHPSMGHPVTPKNPSGRVLSSSSVHRQDDDLRPRAPATAPAPAKATPTAAGTAQAAATPDAGSPAQTRKRPR